MNRIYKYIATLTFACLFLACNRSEKSNTLGIIGPDESVEVEKPNYAEYLFHRSGSVRKLFCNAVKLNTAELITAAHCLKTKNSHKPNFLGSGGIAKNFKLDQTKDLATGILVGGAAPSEAADIYKGIVPHAFPVEATWFDLEQLRWKSSTGEARLIRSQGNLFIQHDLDMKPGSSGSGIFILTPEGKKLIGLHLGYDEAKKINLGIFLGAAVEGVASFDQLLYRFERSPDYCYQCKAGPNGELYECIMKICDAEGDGGGGGGDSGDDGMPGPDGPGDGPGTGEGGEGGPGSGGEGEGGDDSDGSSPSRGGLVITEGGTGEDSGNGGDNGTISGGSGNDDGLTSGVSRDCVSCKGYDQHLLDRSLFRPNCIEESGFNNLFTGVNTGGINIKVDGQQIFESDGLTGALKKIAEDLIKNNPWVTPSGFPEAVSNLSEESVKKIEKWSSEVLKSIDDYYALVVASLPPGQTITPSNYEVDATEEGIKEARDYIESIKEQVKSNPDRFLSQRLEIVEAAQQFVDYSEEALKKGDKEKAEMGLKIGLAVADGALSLIPGVSWGKDVYEAISGKNLVSGEKLSSIERGLAIAGVVTLGLGSKLGTVAKGIKTGTEIFQQAIKAGKTAEEAADIAKAAEKVIELGIAAQKTGVEVEKVAEGVRSAQRVLAEGNHTLKVAHDGREVFKYTKIDPGVPKLVTDKRLSKEAKQILQDGGTNKDLMKVGYAPIGADGKKMEIHHVLGIEPGAVIEMEATAHTVKFKEFHNMLIRLSNSWRNDPALPRQFDRFRELHWTNRANDF